MKKILVILCVATVLLASSCNYVSGKRIRGNGNVKSEDRTESSFTGVEAAGSFNTYVGIGPQSIKIEAEENIIPYIGTHVENGMLKIDTKDGFWLKTSRSIKIYVTAPRLNNIIVTGTGDLIGTTKITDSSRIDLRVHGNADMKIEVDAPQIDADLTGNGDIEVKGQTRNFESRATGNGHIKAMDLQTENAKIQIYGNGNADVSASVKLDVRIGGNGNVRYKGAAQVSSQITGNGNVRKVD
jgi:Putative auto-transporter adhesin, head GIN domain